MVQARAETGTGTGQRVSPLWWVVRHGSLSSYGLYLVFVFLATLAEFLALQSRHHESAVYHRRAAELAPTDYALVVAAATSLRLLDRKVEAELWYRKVSKDLYYEPELVLIELVFS